MQNFKYILQNITQWENRLNAHSELGCQQIIRNIFKDPDQWASFKLPLEELLMNPLLSFINDDNSSSGYGNMKTECLQI